MQLEFGAYQHEMSERMLRFPKLSKVVRGIFGYTGIGNYARYKVYKDLLKEIPLREAEKILDLGCGYGEYSFMLADALPDTQITALDVVGEKTALIDRVIHRHQKKNLTTFTGKVDQLSETGFDFIFSVDVFEHIDPADMPFKDCMDRLAVGGHLLVKIPNKTQRTLFPDSWFEEHHDWLEDEHIGQIYDLDGLVNRFKDEGFEIVYAAYSDGWWARIAWEFWYLSKKGGGILHLLTLPISKLLIWIDRLAKTPSEGNAIQVIGRKP
ncbi:MAG: class I SAM-dependent methyltransferase [Bacteroidota bacterium]